MAHYFAPRLTLVGQRVVVNHPHHVHLVGALSWMFSSRYLRQPGEFTVVEDDYSKVLYVVRWFFPNVVDRTGLAHRPIEQEWLERFTKYLARIGGTIEPLEVPSPWEVLCVTETAPWEVVTAAYRALVKLCHPDTAKQEDLEALAVRFRAVMDAYDQLRRERVPVSRGNGKRKSAT